MTASKGRVPRRQDGTNYSPRTTRLTRKGRMVPTALSVAVTQQMNAEAYRQRGWRFDPTSTGYGPTRAE